MTILIMDEDCGDETPSLKCASCDMVFHIYWNRNPIYDHVEYCPFCGEEVEETIPIEEGE